MTNQTISWHIATCWIIKLLKTIFSFALLPPKRKFWRQSKQKCLSFPPPPSRLSIRPSLKTTRRRKSRSSRPSRSTLGELEKECLRRRFIRVRTVSNWPQSSSRKSRRTHRASMRSTPIWLRRFVSKFHASFIRFVNRQSKTRTGLDYLTA